MAEATEGEDVGGHRLSPRIQGYPRDLLRQFASSSSSRSEESLAAVEDDSSEIELSLGLSLNGCFGVEKKRVGSGFGGLVRSSSIASLPLLQREPLEAVVAIPTLTRTCSLPVETEEEQRKRKEMQSLRRLEAKRKRSEKRNSFRSGPRDRASASSAAAEENCCDEDLQQQVGGVKLETEQNGVVVAAAGQQQQQGWAAVSSLGAVARELDGMTRSFATMSQGSVGSQGSSSSGGGGGMSNFEREMLRPPPPGGQQGFDIAGLRSTTETRSPPSSIRSLPPELTTEQKAVAAAGSVGLLAPDNHARAEADDPRKKQATTTAGRSNGMMREMQRNMMEEMPCVSTRGDGPNGRRIEGFLYKYRKGEEVRIVCVCHGSFLTPAEFVKHAGGGDVAHPLRHIVVNPTPSSFL